MRDVVVRDSKTHGKGVFAARNFKKGEVVMVWDTAHKLTREKLRNLSQDEQNHTNYAGKGLYILMRAPERYVNHSCEPNTFMRDFKDIALRNIKKGEEITTDYSLNSAEGWVMNCVCKSKNCRKIIYGDFRKLPKDVQKKIRAVSGGVVQKRIFDIPLSPTQSSPCS
jgi:SET domain-containing protein